MKRISLLTIILILAINIFAEQFHISMKSSVDKNKIKVGEYFTLKILIETIGNVSAASYKLPALPNMDWAINVATSNSSNSMMINNNIKTKITISATYKARIAGKFVIPSVKMSYKDPNSGQNLDLDTEEIQMNVKKQGISLSFLIALLIIIVIIIMTFVAINNNGKRNRTENKMQDVTVQDAKEFKSKYEDLKIIKDPQIKFNKLEDAFRGFLLEKYHITRNILRDEIKEIIAKKEISKDVQETLYDILDFIYLTKYKGFALDNSELDKWIEKLENLSEK